MTKEWDFVRMISPRSKRKLRIDHHHLITFALERSMDHLPRLSDAFSSPALVWVDVEDRMDASRWETR